MILASPQCRFQTARVDGRFASVLVKVYCTVQYPQAGPSECIANLWIAALGDMIEGAGESPMAQGEQHPTATVSVVHPADLRANTAQTGGSLRMSAIAAGDGIPSSMWAGMFVVEASAATGIHHHGEQDTIVYVLEGEAVVRWGAMGEHSATVRAGDFLHIPGWLPHQELNPSAEAPFRWVVVRSTPEPIVVNLPDDFWTSNPDRRSEAA
jgi:uncharacterized RmlC-like cupin family protein